MKRMLALLLAVVMVLGLVACGNDGTTTADTSAAEATPAASTATEEVAPVELTEEDYAESGTAIYRVLYGTEVTTLNYLTTSNTYEQAIGANVIDTLVEYDSDGEMQPSLATAWSYDEATCTWTLTLRDDATWVDNTGAVVAKVTAQDFVDGLAYGLDPANGSSTISLVFGIIENAEEYYNYMDALAMATSNTTDDDGNVYTVDEAGVVTITAADGTASTMDPVSFEDVGVKAVNDTTLTYTLCGTTPYFLSMLTYVVFMPVYGPEIEEFGTDFATSAETMYYNGAFYLSEFAPQQKQTLTKNAENWDAEHVYLDEIQKIYNAEASTVGPEMVKRGEIDYCELSSDVVDAWKADAETADMISIERPAIDYSYFYCFNFNMKKLNDSYYRDTESDGWTVDEQYEPWNWEIAVNNEAFRQAIRHAIYRTATYYVETGDEETAKSYQMNTITPTGFAVDTATGLDYTECEAFAEINASDSFDAELAQQYKEQAMTELAEQGVTFPVKVLVRYNPSTSNWADECTVLEQQLESVLGTDFIDIIVEAGPESGFLSAVRRSCDYMLLWCNWGADYADPETYTDPFYQAVDETKPEGYNRGMRYAYLAYAITDNTASAETVKEYFSLVEAAKAITDDTTARYNAFATAEAYLIDHALVVPGGVSVSSYVVSKLNPFEGEYAAFGVSSLRYKGQHLLNDFYTMANYAADSAD